MLFRSYTRAEIPFLLQEDIHLLGAFQHFGRVEQHGFFSHGIGPEHAPAFALHGRSIACCSAIVFLFTPFGHPFFTITEFLLIDQQIYRVVEAEPKNSLVGMQTRIEQNFIGRHFEGCNRCDRKSIHIHRSFNRSFRMNNYILPSQKCLTIGHIAQSGTPAGNAYK